ncbi:S-layer homology domain-containing protein [Cohnella sp. REN36]|uniref:S-layer homology domain-containing protein n=1 Tax=Cohnella sp. REN36 TaxID=2887347 RepID=UPI001D147464|nr:S-layer homology domain-containing protein [Cohnella sp. REN36]MCC3372494.1 S-layer homology domain-containing protein [Cohnella sp. REN36]
MKKAGLLFSALLLMVTLAVPYRASAAIVFYDVGVSYWAYPQIISMSEVGLIKGYSDNSFKPKKAVTREEFAALITRAFYLDLPDDGAKQTFADVAKSRWSFGDIEAAKDFLTGYYPPSGKAFFDPTASATREDVAVALVKTLGYQPDDLQDEGILDRFYDGDKVSPNMQTYVALAVENKLVTGYEDGTFRPNQGVTRAEAAALLYRVIKGAAGDSQQGLGLNVSVPETTQTPTFYITGDVIKGAKVYINNKEVQVTQGQFREGFRLNEEGTYTYTITARLSGGKTETVTKAVKYEKGAPTLTVNGVPETTDKKTITVTWTVKDSNDPSPVVYVNGQKQYGTSGSAQVNLEDGDNEITVVAENSAGKSAKVVKHVVFQGNGPTLNVMNVPESTDKDTLNVTWTVQDKNDPSPKVYLNGQQLYGTSTTVSLREGANTLSFKAVNSLGKTTEVTKTVVLNGAAPTLAVDPLPATTNKNSVRVSWTVQDKNDASPKVYVNGEQAYGSSANVSLQPGANRITVRAVNKQGKSTEKTLEIAFANGGPSLVIQSVPDTTNKKTVTVSWTVSDSNDSNPKVYVNDQQAYGSSATVSLTPGSNTIKFKAVNNAGAATEDTRTIVFEPSAPKLVLGYAPETTSAQTITLTWTVTDDNDSSPKVYVNDQLINYSTSLNVTLNPGANPFKLVASNSYGKTTEVFYTVTYTPASQ